MIVSASYRTDIPTFYGQWFMNRLRAGFCYAVNPYGKQVYRVRLDGAAVDGFVFWTKNVAPFLEHLPEVKDRGFPFIVQHAITGYPRQLETSVVDWQKAVEHAHRLRDLFGPHVLVWRYDTILMSSLTPPDFHVTNFSRLAAALSGTTDEVVVSFTQTYRKTRHNLDQAAGSAGFSWSDPSDAEKRTLLAVLVPIARDHGMRVSICSQRSYVIAGTGAARCVDARRLETVAGHPIHAKLKGNRPDCGCFESRDIGDYDTCPHGCVYCYAVQNRELALERFRRHDPESPFLFDPPAGTRLPPEALAGTLPLFKDEA